MAYGSKKVVIPPAEPPTSNDVLKLFHSFRGIYWFNNNWHAVDTIEVTLDGTGGIIWETSYIALKTGTTIGSSALIDKNLYKFRENADIATWEKIRRVRINFWTDGITERVIHAVSGAIGPAGDVANPYEHIGFKQINDVLYATVADGTTEKAVAIKTLTGAWQADLEAILFPGGKCEFYIDGVLAATITTNLPTGTSSAYQLFRANIYNTEAAQKVLYIPEVSVLQEE